MAFISLDTSAGFGHISPSGPSLTKRRKERTIVSILARFSLKSLFRTNVICARKAGFFLIVVLTWQNIKMDFLGVYLRRGATFVKKLQRRGMKAFKLIFQAIYSVLRCKMFH